MLRIQQPLFWGWTGESRRAWGPECLPPNHRVHAEPHPPRTPRKQLLLSAASVSSAASVPVSSLTPARWISDATHAGPSLASAYDQSGDGCCDETDTPDTAGILGVYGYGLMRLTMQSQPPNDAIVSKPHPPRTPKKQLLSSVASVASGASASHSSFEPVRRRLQRRGLTFYGKSDESR
jgi:hypothetical protein